MSRLARGIALSFSFALASCTPRDANGPAVTVRDSAGVEIVQNRGAVEELPEWRPAEPVLRRGAAEAMRSPIGRSASPISRVSCTSQAVEEPS